MVVKVTHSCFNMFVNKETCEELGGHSLLRMYLWGCLCTLYFTRMLGESYRRRLRSLLLYLCDDFRALLVHVERVFHMKTIMSVMCCTLFVFVFVIRLNLASSFLFLFVWFFFFFFFFSSSSSFITLMIKKEEEEKKKKRKKEEEKKKKNCCDVCLLHSSRFLFVLFS